MQATNNISSLITFHFANFSLPWLLFNSAILYTIGNYHVLKYGQAHFIKILALSATAGSFMSALAVHNDKNFIATGGISFSSGLIGYNAFKNPAWFKFALNPVSLIAALVLYSVFYNDRAALGGLGLGYAAFLAGL